MSDPAAVNEASEHARIGTISWPRFFGQFCRLAGPYWRGERKWRARWLAAALVGLTVCQVAVAIALNFWNEQLFDALEQKALNRFLNLSAIFLAIIVVDIIVVTTHLRVKRRLQVDWREWLTERVTGEWMAGGRHYRLALGMFGAHDNPDARIAEDVRIATEYAVDIAHSALYSNLVLISFLQILWSLSGVVELTLGGVAVEIPGHLVWIAVIYATIGTWIGLRLGRPLMQAANRRQSAEADFRFGLIHARENSLAIALLKGEGDERRRFARLYSIAIMAWDRQTAALRGILAYTSVWGSFLQVFPILLAAPRYIAGSITLGVLMQSAQAFQHLVSALSWPVDNLAKAADWRASVERVVGLRQAMQALDAADAAPSRRRVAMRAGDGPLLEFDRLALDNADGREVLPALSAEIKAGERVLIAGDSEITTLLFQALAGLWPWGSGLILLPSTGPIYCVPRRPYLPFGSLRDAVCYPMSANACGDTAIAAVLDRAGLTHWADRLDRTQTWEQALPPADQQRLGFARLLLHRPNWIFLHESTDALDLDGEAAMMALLNREFADATVLMVGHHPSLDAHFQRRLTVARNNGDVVVTDKPLVHPHSA